MGVWYRSYTSSTYKKSSSVKTTDADGRVSWTVKPSVRYYYRIRYAGASGVADVTGATRYVDPKASVTAPRNGSTVYRGRTYTWYGYMKPKHTSGTTAGYLYFYRYKKLANGTYGYVYYKKVKATTSYYSSKTTKYKARTSLPYRGKWRVRFYHNDAGHAPTYSSYLYKTVK